jgi:hypothetical protein
MDLKMKSWKGLNSPFPIFPLNLEIRGRNRRGPAGSEDQLKRKPRKRNDFQDQNREQRNQLNGSGGDSGFGIDLLPATNRTVIVAFQIPMVMESLRHGQGSERG